MPNTPEIPQSLIEKCARAVWDALISEQMPSENVRREVARFVLEAADYTNLLADNAQLRARVGVLEAAIRDYIGAWRVQDDVRDWEAGGPSFIDMGNAVDEAYEQLEQALKGGPANG